MGRVHRGIDDRAEDLLRFGFCQDAGIAIGAHAARVRALVAVAEGFVILRGRERDDVASVRRGQ